ncbi:MAG: DUF1629 domain-containing protein [Aliishimia sp.]
MSKRVRDVIVEQDFASSWFAPIVFQEKDVTEHNDTYWLHRVVRDVDALIAEKPKVRRAMRRVCRPDGSLVGEDLGFYEVRDAFDL